MENEIYVWEEWDVEEAAAAAEVTPCMQLCLETSPSIWGISLLVEPFYTIKRVINEVKTMVMEDDETYLSEDVLRLVGSLEETAMLMFNGMDLLEHPSRTLHDLGIKNHDKVTILDKRPFMIKISVRKKRSTDKAVEIVAHDTVHSLKEKIETLLGIPLEKQRLCYADNGWMIQHFVLCNDFKTLTAYGIVKDWSDFQPQIWVYTDDDPALEETHCSPVASPYSSSRMEIVVQVCRANLGDHYLYIAVESWYTVNQLMSMIRENNSFNEICVLVFQCMNLLEHRTSTLGKLGIKDQDRIIIPLEGPFSIFIRLSSSSLEEQPEVRQRYFQVKVEAFWSVITLKEKIETTQNIPVKNQRLCHVIKGIYDEECHLAMTDDSRSLATFGIVRHVHHGLCIEVDN